MRFVPLKSEEVGEIVIGRKRACLMSPRVYRVTCETVFINILGTLPEEEKNWKMWEFFPRRGPPPPSPSLQFGNPMFVREKIMVYFAF